MPSDDKKTRRRSSFASHRVSTISETPADAGHECTNEPISNEDETTKAECAPRLLKNPQNVLLEDASVHYNNHLQRLREESEAWDCLLADSEKQLLSSQLQFEPCLPEKMTDEMREYHRSLLGDVPNYADIIAESRMKVNCAILKYEQIELKMENLRKIQRRLENAVHLATENFCKEHLSVPETPRTLLSAKIYGPPHP